MIHNFHVDDLLKSLKTSDDATKVYEKLTELLLLDEFHLTKWISNETEVLDVIPESEMTKKFKNIDLEIDRLPVETTLKMQRNVETGQFQNNIKIKNKPFTGRGMLTTILLYTGCPKTVHNFV